MEGFNIRLQEQKDRSRKAAEVAAGDWVEITALDGTTKFIGYDHLSAEVQIVKYREVISKRRNTTKSCSTNRPFMQNRAVRWATADG